MKESYMYTKLSLLMFLSSFFTSFCSEIKKPEISYQPLPLYTLTTNEKKQTLHVSECRYKILNENQIAFMSPCRPCVGIGVKGKNHQGITTTTVFHVATHSDISDLPKKITHLYHHPFTVKMKAFTVLLDREIFEEDHKPLTNKSQKEWFLSLSSIMQKKLSIPQKNIQLIMFDPACLNREKALPSDYSILINGTSDEHGFPTMYSVAPNTLLEKNEFLRYRAYLDKQLIMLMRYLYEEGYPYKINDEGDVYCPFLSADTSLPLLISLKEQGEDVLLIIKKQSQACGYSDSDESF